MPAPVVAVFPLTTTFTAPATPTNSDLGTVTVSENTAAAITGSAAPITSVAELTPNTSFGGDIVNIAPGPGGAFGSDVYAISRGAGGNASAINRPGTIYRVDPATGKASVFFDLNTVLSQTDTNNTSTTSPAANSLGASSGLVNWYSMTFDPEGSFDGTPSLFVSSVDTSDPAKNIIYQISPSGSLIGVFVQFTDGLASQKFLINPTAILIPPVQEQSFLSSVLGSTTSGQTGGMIAGSGESSTNTPSFAALYFDSSVYSPGQVISNATLPGGVSETALGLPVASTVLSQDTTITAGLVHTGPIVGLTASNASYNHQIFSVFTDFGTPAGGGIPARPGYSGVQDSNGDLFIGATTNTTTYSAGTSAGSGSPSVTDQIPAVTTPFRRFYGIAFDQFGYFSQSIPLTATSATTSGTTITIGSAAPLYAGSLFVSDLASGLYVSVTPLSPLPTSPILVPVQGSGLISVTTDASGNVVPVITGGNTTGGSNDFGGRILRIEPNGTTSIFAYGFDVSGAQDASSFVDSTLSIGFSDDGTILYAADDAGIWQFKTTADLADSTSGSLIGLSDLRALGVPYDGQNAAVAVVDTGVDANSTSFRGRVAPGVNVTNGGLGNKDLLGVLSTSTGTGGTGGTGTGTTSNSVLLNSIYGHGTPVAGVVAQFVPDATIDPINVFGQSPFEGGISIGGGSGGTGGTGGTGGGGTGGGTGGTGTGGTIFTNDLGATAETVFDGLQYLTQHPYVNDPIRPGQVDRIIAAVYAFGTPFTFQSEADAYRQFPQVVVALKNEYHKLRKEGIANIAATGEFGAPLLAGSSSGSTTGTTSTTGSVRADNNAENTAVGDVKGISLPAVINEVISVTGVYSFPFTLTPSTSPIDTPTGVIPNPEGPILLFGPSLTIGGTASSGGTGGTGGTGGGGTGTTTASGYTANASLLAAGDYRIWADRIPGSVNRNVTTDFAAPAFNVPTFSRTYTSAATSGGTGGTGSTGTGGTGTTGTGTGSTTTGGAFISNPMAFNVVGTSMSSAIVTGSYALISSALNYWTGLAQSNGYTSDAYLNTPVGTDSLNFGKHAFKNLGAWNNPDAINGILAWTAVPATDVNDINTVSTPYQLPNSTAYASYARVSVSNAVASIEGTEAINYLNKHHDWTYIDTNHDGLITAQELTTFTNNADSMGMPEAGAMAALLGGTATYGPVLAGVNNTDFNENPDQPGAEQRRFNYFDYAADGQLNGSISINEFKMLGRILLPSPDAYTIIDRQRAAANGFLLAPSTPRNFVAIKNLQPSYLWIPKSTVARYRNITPAQFTVGENEKGGTYLPVFTLFNPSIVTNAATTTPDSQSVGLTKSSNLGGNRLTVDYMVYTPSPTPAATPTSTSSGSGGTTTGTGTATSTGQTTSSTAATPSPSSTQQGTGTTTTPSASGTPTSTSTSPTSTTTTTTTTSTTTVQTTSTPSPTSSLSAALSTLLPAGTETPLTSSSTSSGTGSPTTAASSASSSGTGSTTSGTTGSGATGTGSGTTATTATTTPSPTPSPTATTTPTPTATTSSTSTPTPTPTSSTTVAPAPLAYSTGPTIAVSPTPTATAQAQNPPKAERQAVQHYVHAHKKQSSIDKLWGNVKKALGIK